MRRCCRHRHHYYYMFFLLVTWTILLLLPSSLAFVFPNTNIQNHDERIQNYYPSRQRLVFSSSFLRHSSPSSSSQQQQSEQPSEQLDQNNDLTYATASTSTAVRLNKVFKATHSRRQADALIQSGRVSVNGRVILSHQVGTMVIPFVDVVAVDGQVWSAWEDHVLATEMKNMVPTVQQQQRHDHDDVDNSSSENSTATPSTTAGSSSSTCLEYIKYWKPRGVICTTDRRIPNNVLDRLEQVDGCTDYQNRIFPVGRLDQDTSGLLLLTSDGRLPQSMLRSKPKVYHVQTQPPFVTDDDVERLRRGVVITTVAQRDHKRGIPRTAPTLPCQVERGVIGVDHTNNNNHKNGKSLPTLVMTLYEGRNRQIRKMLSALGYTVVKLHRTTCLGITMDGLHRPGDWARLTSRELQTLFQKEESPHQQSQSQPQEQQQQ